MTGFPTVSVIIPTYNRTRFISEAVESVLAQTYSDYEILVVDDGSIDNTKDVLLPYQDKVIYIYQKNQGVSAARNTGIRNSKGKYIAFLDSDDMWLPEKLEKQVEILDKYPDISMVYSNISYCDEKGRYIRTASKANMFQSGHIPEKVLLWKVNCGYLQTWLIRKSCFDEIGLLDTTFKMSEDREMSVRIAMNYNIYGLKEPLTMVRQHRPSERLGRSPAKEREYYYFKFLDHFFDKYKDFQIVEMTRKKLIAGYYWYAGKNYLRDGDMAEANDRFKKSIGHNPVRPSAYFYWFVTLIGEGPFHFLNKIRKAVLSVSNLIRRSIGPRN